MVTAASAKPPSAAHLNVDMKYMTRIQNFTGGKSWRNYLEDGGEDGEKNIILQIFFLSN
jgi:hypothetical protein